MVLRVRKQGSSKFTVHQIDEEQYSLDELQEQINYGIEHRTPITIAVKKANKRLVKFNPIEMDTISVLFDYE